MFGNCNHNWHLDKREDATRYVIFHFLCNKCGKPKTVIREFGNEFDIEVE